MSAQYGPFGQGWPKPVSVDGYLQVVSCSRSELWELRQLLSAVEIKMTAIEDALRYRAKEHAALEERVKAVEKADGKPNITDSCSELADFLNKFLEALSPSDAIWAAKADSLREWLRGVENWEINIDPNGGTDAEKATEPKPAPAEPVRDQSELHDFGWALRQMREGNLVRRSTWPKSPRRQTISIHHTQIESGVKAPDFIMCHYNMASYPWATQGHDLLATDWEVAE